MQIIGIVNSEKDNLIRTKISSSIMSSCIYYIVDEPSEYEIWIILVTKMNNSISLSVKPYLENEIKDLFYIYLKVSKRKWRWRKNDITWYKLIYCFYRDLKWKSWKRNNQIFYFLFKFYNDNIKESIKRELSFYSFKSNKHSLLIKISNKK
jgi:hypothetical protein